MIGGVGNARDFFGLRAGVTHEDVVETNRHLYTINTTPVTNLTIHPPHRRFRSEIPFVSMIVGGNARDFFMCVQV